MSVTEELRRMLDERGIEWNYGMHGPSCSTEFGKVGKELTFLELSNGLVCSTYVKPEQAIDMVFGRGAYYTDQAKRLSDANDTINELMTQLQLAECETCELTESKKRPRIERYAVAKLRVCSECGAEVLASPVNYCPSCGRRVAE